MRYLIIVLAIFVIVTSCTTATKMQSVTPGMSKAEVMKTLGKPTTFKVEGEKEIWAYVDCYASEFSKDKTDFYFVFVNDKLVESGRTEVREKETGGGVFFIWPVTN